MIGVKVMRIVLWMFIIFSHVALSENKVHISDQMLLSGGQEIVLTGDPEVTTDNGKGQVYSESTSSFKFSDHSQRLHHINDVRFMSNQGLIFSGREVVEHIDNHVHQMVFTEELVVYESSVSESASTTYQCQSLKLLLNGQVIQPLKVNLVRGINVHCDANDNPVLNLSEYVFVPH